MYEEHFHFDQTPFSIAPDPNFLYLSEGHSEALAHLMYGFSHGGFVMITGEVGTGKTTLLRNLVRQTPPDLDVAFILNPRLTVKELLETLCDELGIPYPSAQHPTIKQYIDVLNKYLVESYRRGRSTVLIIDEAQNLSPAVLEQIRLLTNLETDSHKLLRIILLGQPELGRLLERTELRQLAQRITARYHLGQLGRADCYAYVVHRLSQAGGDPQLFPRASLALLYRLSKGIPRVLNVIADRALLGAYVEGRHRIPRRIVRRAANEVLGKPTNYRLWATSAAASLGMAGIAWAYFALPGDQAAPAPSTQPAKGAEQIVQPYSRTQASPANIQPSAPTIARRERERPPPAAPSEAENQPAPPQKPRSAPSEPATKRPPPRTVAVQRPDMDRYVGQRKAYVAAFAAWGADYAPEVDTTIPCNFAPTAGLQCLNQQGGWRAIKRLNRPVVLELWGDGTGPFHGAVLRLKGNHVTLQVGDERIETTRAAIGRVWQGDYMLLWQTPPDYHGSLASGDVHATVGWLRSQLSGLVDQSIASSRPNFFDADLDAAVREFQDAQGLQVDGVVGPMTWIHLTRQLQLPGPVLDG